MLWYRPGDSLRAEFTTSLPSNGAAAYADTSPSVVLARNGNVDGDVEFEVEPLETGRYAAVCQIPSDYDPGDIIALRITAVVSGVTGRDTLLETRLIGIDLTDEIATQLFVDGGDNLLKVNVDNSINGQVVLSPESLALISAAINASTLTANQLAAALSSTTEVVLVGPYMNGPSHKMVRGSAYLKSISTAPFIRVAKALYNLAGATAEFRIKLERQSPVIVAATIMSFDDNYYEVYADLDEDDTAAVTAGLGHDQFWAILSGGANVNLSHTYLEVIDGINVD